MYEAAASCTDIARAPITKWEPHGVTLAGYRYAVRHGMKAHLVTPYRVSHLQRDGVTARGNVTVCTELNAVKITGLWDVTAGIMEYMYHGYRGTYIQPVPSW